MKDLTKSKLDWEAIAKVLATWPVCHSADPTTGKRTGPYHNMWTRGIEYENKEAARDGALRAALAEVEKNRTSDEPDPKCESGITMTSGDETLARARLDRVISILTTADDPGHKPFHEIIKHALDAARGKGEIPRDSAKVVMPGSTSSGGCSRWPAECRKA